MAEPSRTHLRLWLRLLAATNEMERALRRRLRDEFGTTLPRFDVMAALDRAPEGLSMSELSRRLMVTNGNTTVLVAALEKDGLVQRSVPAERSPELHGGADRRRPRNVRAHGGRAFRMGLRAALGCRSGLRQRALAGPSRCAARNPGKRESRADDEEMT